MTLAQFFTLQPNDLDDLFTESNETLSIVDRSDLRAMMNMKGRNVLISSSFFLVLSYLYIIRYPFN